MEGSDQEMDQVIQALNSRMNDFIREVDLNTLPATGEFEQFHIKH
jgi:hypothetical protein